MPDKAPEIDLLGSQYPHVRCVIKKFESWEVVGITQESVAYQISRL